MVEPLECEVTRKARSRFVVGSLLDSLLKKWLLLTVMLLEWACAFSQMPKITGAGEA